jgi:DNA-binding FrmR family transcriptional regulator
VRGYTLDKDDYHLRLRKIEGQVRGIQRLVEDDTYCIDILTQITSVNAALQKVALGLVDQHLRHCVMEAVATNPEAGEKRLAEAILAVERLAQL